MAIGINPALEPNRQGVVRRNRARIVRADVAALIFHLDRRLTACREELGIEAQGNVVAVRVVVRGLLLVQLIVFHRSHPDREDALDELLIQVE